MKGFSKYVPVTEEEYKRFKQQQQQQVLQTQQELQQPAPLSTLTTVQNQKDRELFLTAANPELQARRFKQLVHMINALKKQIATTTVAPRIAEAQTKADHFLNILGPQMWNERDELVFKGEAIPQSNRQILTDYAVSDWRTKFKTPPKGGTELKEIIREIGIAPQYLGRGIQQKERMGVANKVKRLKQTPKAVDTPGKKRKTALGQNSSAKLAKMVLSNPQAYRKLMRSK